ncbi:MAG: hypothetical protein KJZ91_09000 [Myxococcales bacterium]|nr:hypothetical protein [Myxococcales bacterium]
MTVVELAAGYAGIGVILALVAVGRGRAGATDAALLIGLWPLYAPLLAGGDRAALDPREQALIDGLRRAAATPLAGALPDEAGARALFRRVREGRARLADLDLVLARPDLGPRAAAERLVALERDGAHPAAVATARRRVETVARLRDLRARMAGDLDQVDEVVTQLLAQLELARFAGAADDAAAELAADLSARIDSLDEVLRAWNEPAGSRVTPP